MIPNLLASSMEKEDGCSRVGGAVASDCVEDGCRYRGRLVLHALNAEATEWSEEV